MQLVTLSAQLKIVFSKGQRINFNRLIQSFDNLFVASPEFFSGLSGNKRITLKTLD